MSATVAVHRADDQRLLTLVGCIQGIVLELDGEAHYVNAWADDPALLARPAHEMIGRTINEVLGEAGAPFTAMVKRVYATGCVEHLEYPLELGGVRHWFSADIKRVGTPEAGMTVVFFARDITDRKRTEEALARSEERYRLAAKATQDLLWDWDLVHDTVDWNSGVTEVLGYAQPGPGASWWKELLHPDEREQVVTRLTGVLASDVNAWSARYRFLRADGTYADFVDRGFITRDASGRPVRMVGSMTDVTRINTLQAQLLQADRMAALGTLAAGVGHEINNPLTYLIANLESSLEALGEGDATRELINDALEGARRIADTVKSLKMFTRGDNSELRPVEINQVVDATLKVALKEIRHRARLTCSLSATRRVHASEAQLAQLFLNLLINAAQSIPDGCIDQHEIRVSTTDEGGRVRICIEDTGSGVSPEHLPRIFDPFFTTKPVGHGTGLGLAICHGIVEQHGGTIRVTSELGRGTTVTVELPAIQVATTSALPRVLVIDDEAMVGRVITRMMRTKAEVVALTRAREGLDRLLACEAFDLVLCDLMMPEMTGIELYEELSRAKPELLGKVFFMTGGAFTPRAQAFVERIGSARLDKPLDRAQVLALLPNAR